MSDTEPLIQVNQVPLDDCWNRIGVFGNKQCPELERHVHCRNCQVYGAAAIALLDRYATVLQQHDYHPEEQDAEHDGELRSVMVFRLGEQWLGLATSRLAEVMPVSPIHCLPHRNARGLLGVSNVRGTLVACMSLAQLLDLPERDSTRGQQRVVPRMLIIESDSGPIVVPVDEVNGIQRVPVADIHPISRDDERAISRYSSGVLQWQGRSITLLDDQSLLQFMIGSLA